MAASDPISALTALGGAPATGDLLVTVDVSDSTQSANGTTKKMTTANLFTSPTISNPTISNPTITGGSGAASFTSVTTTGDATIGGNTAITGGATIGGTATITGAASAASIATTGAANIGGAMTSSGVVSSGGVTSSASTGPGIGYATGAGGTVTQATSRLTSVTINKLSGQITTNNGSLGAGAVATFTVNNSTVAATDVPLIVLQSGSTVPAHDTTVWVSAVASGSFTITTKAGSSSETGALVITFVILKAVAA